MIVLVLIIVIQAMLYFAIILVTDNLYNGAVVYNEWPRFLEKKLENRYSVKWHLAENRRGHQQGWNA